jgi:hypothetical protein
MSPEDKELQKLEQRNLCVCCMCIHIILRWAYGHNWHVPLKKTCFPSFTRISNAPHTHSGNPQRKNCAVQAFRISEGCVLENCADLADCSGGRIRMKNRFWITVQSQTAGRPERVWRRVSSVWLRSPFRQHEPGISGRVYQYLRV